MMNRDDDLTEEQSNALRLMRAGDNVFLTGPAGTGKSYVINKFRDWCDKSNRIVAVTSTTGVSAILIGGNTLHSWAGIGLGKDSVQSLTNKIRNRKKYKQRWLNTHTLIIDEISMLDSELFEKLDKIGRKVRENYIQPFGGIQLIFCGDFCQLRPVKAEHYCFESKQWEYCVTHTIHLTRIIRQDDVIFQNCLNEIRMGIITDQTKDILNRRLLYPNGDLKRENENRNSIQPTKLYSYRANVSKINNDKLRKLKKLNREHHAFKSKVKIKNNNTYKLEKYQIDKYVDMLDKWCQAESKVEFAVGSQVMLICNLDLEAKLANGSRGVIVRYSDRILPIVRFLSGEEREIEYWDWTLDLKEDNVELTYSQMPLILADAITIHRSQGSTLDLVEVDLGKTIFEFGQFYTALSRVRNLQGLFLVDLDFDKVKIHPKVLEFYNKLKQKF